MSPPTQPDARRCTGPAASPVASNSRHRSAARKCAASPPPTAHRPPQPRSGPGEENRTPPRLRAKTPDLKPLESSADPHHGIDRNRALLHDHFVAVDGAGDFGNHRLHIRKIGRADFTLRRTHGNK